MRVPLIFLLLISFTYSYKILVYNIRYSHSHSNFLGNVADILVEAGHDVTSFIPEVSATVADGTTKSKVVRIPPTPSVQAELKKMLPGAAFFELGDWVHVMMGTTLSVVFEAQCRETLKRMDVIEKLRDEKFDVYIVENADMCGMALTELIKPKSIIMTGTTALYGHQFDEVGAPQPLSVTPRTFLDSFSFWSRVHNLYAEVLTRYAYGKSRTKVLRLFRDKFGSDFPDFEQITSHIAYCFINTEPLLDVASPTISRVIPIGGLGAKQPKELDEYWQGILSLRPRAVLISFGSLIKSQALTIDVKRSFLMVARAFPDTTFIWKYEKTEDEFVRNEASKVTNVVLSKWMPQNDLLNHPNVSVFITHAGMGSVMETTRRGVPALLVPIFADQHRNARGLVHNGLGKVHSKFELTDHAQLISSLKELMESKKYRMNAKHIARMLAAKPFSSREQLIKYTEFAAEFGPSSALRPQSHDMTLIAYHNLDIITVALVVIILVMFVVFKVFCWFAGRCVGKVKSE
ncbi:hypothetical protein PRIPAC_87179 [Pristionchus pacificus]|uniref:glucuronosyltransferase n=1 Tax=Pristionchus pacificus TaxID=54126 RepID=A0A2A6CWR2_PRIPA|nr:hypothetical protein PRIPAC_87179 [Pristionchus pacificus]|eukprot:PDM82473.1 Glycosyltransferase [Pristionchus pacificus]